MTQRFPHLLSPLTCGRLRLRNRMVMAPMDCNFAAEDGQVTPRMIVYYQKRARGGAGLVIVGSACVEPRRGRFSPHQLNVDSDRLLPGLRRLAQTIRKQGAAAVLQLHHTGGKATAMVTGTEPVAPSPVANRFGEMPRPLAAGEIAELVEHFVNAAARVRMAGFDGVEIHAAHGYLISQFLSPLFNQRQDEYGGSIGNRARFLLEIVAALSRRVGKDYPLLCRLSAIECRAEARFEPIPDGISLEETSTVARWLEQAGVHVLDISTSLVGEVEMHPMSWPEGGLIPHAARIRQAVSIPVIAGGRIPPELAEDALADGKFELVAMGRALIADPELPAKLTRGRPEEVRPCIYCAVCTDPQTAVDGCRCAVNPAFGHERELAIRPTPQPGKVIVAGGGPAGLEAARVARLRGHRVALYEAADALGGRLGAVAKSSPKFSPLSSLRTFLIRRLETLGVELHLGERLTPERAAAEAPDLLILAIGAVPARPEIPGVELPHVLSVVELTESTPPGERVVVIGGGEEGCEAALALADQGRKVSILTREPRPAGDTYEETAGFLVGALSSKKVALLTQVRLQEITSTDVRLLTRRGESRSIPADSVILATGYRPPTELVDELRGSVRETVCAGDCAGVGDLRKALEEGYRAGLAL